MPTAVFIVTEEGHVILYYANKFRVRFIFHQATLILKSSMIHKSVIHQEKQHQEIKKALINKSRISPLRTFLNGQTDHLQSDHCPNGPCSVIGSVF